MVPGKSLAGFYGLAVAAPVAATGLAFIVHDYLPRGNISLVYLLAVLVVATSTAGAVSSAARISAKSNCGFSPSGAWKSRFAGG